MLYPEVEINSLAAGGARDVSQHQPMNLRAVPNDTGDAENRIPGAKVCDSAPGDTGMTPQGSGPCPCTVSDPIWSLLLVARRGWSRVPPAVEPRSCADAS
jgi:hypothetical protein